LTVIFSKAVTWKKAIENSAKEVKMLKVNIVLYASLTRKRSIDYSGNVKNIFMLWS
jgi:hypothetical protein